MRLSQFSPELIDRVYNNRKLLLAPQQIASLVSDPKRMRKIRIFGEYISRRMNIESLTNHLSDYLEGRVNLVLNDVVNFAIDGDSFDDIIKLSLSFR